jgi:uncharacterized protein
MGKALVHRNVSRDRVIVFGRYPMPGRVKTRLIPALGRVGAADLQRQFMEKTLRTVRAYAFNHHARIALCLEGGSRERIGRWLGHGPVVSRQGGGGLGDRMLNAFERAFQGGCGRVVLLGTDIPELERRHLEEAFDALHESDMVIGPSRDGGYWLVGLKRPADVFRGIHWGGEGVLEETLDLAGRLGLKTHFLEPLTDIDTFDDLRSWRKGPFHKGPYVSVIIPTLNEEESIQETIEKASDPDAEIIVVDGGSRDQTRALAEASGVKVLVSGPGRAVQQNKGAGASRGDVFLFLHADTRLPGGYVNHVFETLMPGGTAGGAFRFRTDAPIPLMKTVEFVTNIRSRLFQIPYGDQALFMKRTVFDSLGGFPEVALAEDLLLVRKLRRRGRIRIAGAEAVTSGRRWQRLGVLRTTLINQIVLIGVAMGVSPMTLAQLYLDRRRPRP